MMRSLFIVLISFVAFATASAQSVTDTIEIREIQVLAKRKVEEAGLKITRPDSMASASTLTTSLSDLISSYSPVFIKSSGRGSAATASFRGTAASHTQVVWNGMNLNSPMRGVADLSLLPVFFTDDVFLLHGGSSLTEGSGALGGSIHLNNQPDWNSTLAMSGIFETASFSSQKAFFKLAGGTGKLKSGTRVFYETSENNFPFYNYGVIPQRNDTLKNAGYSKSGILQEFYYRTSSDQVLALRLWFQGSDRDLPQLMSYEGSEKEENQNDRQFRVQYDWKKYSDQFNYHFFSGVNSSSLQYYRATPEFSFVNEDSKSRETSWMNHLRIFRKFNEKMYVTTSLDVNFFDVNIHNNIKGEGYQKQRLESSFLLNWRLKPSERLAAFLLLRSETYDSKVVPAIPGAGLEWQFLKTIPVVFQMNVARNYHKPTLNDLYWLPGGNRDLLPEDGITGDISFSGKLKSGNFSGETELTGFVSKIDNWIIWQPAANGAYYWEAANVKEVLSRGVEYRFSLTAQWNSVRVLSGGNYSFTRTTNQNAVRSVDQSRGKQLIYIPKYKGNFYVAAAYKKSSVKYDLEYIGKRFTTSNNVATPYERVLNPYWLNKISVEQRIDAAPWQLNLKLTVENLLNEDYQSILWRPMPGRFYSFTLAVHYKK